MVATRQHAPAGVPLTCVVPPKLLVELLPATDLPEAPVDDLTNLETINTGSVLHTLRQRFERGQIYTSIGPIILALNPFAPVAECSSATLAAKAADGADPDGAAPRSNLTTKPDDETHAEPEDET